MQKKNKGSTNNVTSASSILEAEASETAKSSGVEAGSEGGNNGELRALNARVEEIEDDE